MKAALRNLPGETIADKAAALRRRCNEECANALRREERLKAETAQMRTELDASERMVATLAAAQKHLERTAEKATRAEDQRARERDRQHAAELEHRQAQLRSDHLAEMQIMKGQLTRELSEARSEFQSELEASSKKAAKDADDVGCYVCFENLL